MIEAYAEVNVPLAIREQISSLLDEAFPAVFEDRTYFKQWPHQRLVAVKDRKVVGQLGLDYRAIRVGDQVIGISGIIDLCVRRTHQGNGIGSALLQRAEIHAREGNVPFMVLMADKPDLYKRNGFVNIHPAFTKWLGIEDRASNSLIDRDLSDCFMAKALTNVSWPSGTIDLLGYLF
ncbi:MAG: GNAT family N-acetyltransferase [Janthinobacterium lividum]